MRERKGYDIEVWKDIINYEGLYQISNLGNVRSLDRKSYHSRGFFINLQGKNIKPSINKNGYFQVNLIKNSKTNCFKINRLVALHFIKNCNNLVEVNHIDGNKSNNIVENLEWVSKRENCCHRSSLLNKNNYIGVIFDKERNKYKSSIRIKNKNIFLGRFSTQEEAYQARVQYEKDNNIINKYL